MVELLVLYLHAVAALYAFTKRWQEHGFTGGILAVTFIGFLFLLGWSLSGALARILFPSPMLTPWLSRDAVGLLILLPAEIALFITLFVRR
ncbi:MAG: hypothetical protein NZ473_08260 [Candidatus Kapabacteria bacterium]|nr:hypothetical protein [Candidatus Kapabacteria bacterium]MCS7170184.1 hypothetical protein [Candidatus Kapabacteria bacterium]MDW7997591.1 hypothetical protein [Bacteroidota bacterium]MDW8225677.1 hypothetical protein [Bacteroidota bacterium]